MQKSKKVSDSRTEMAYLITPADANFMGKVAGGVILKLIDQIAYVAACKHADSYCVTASVDRVNFHHPIELGDLVTLKASVNSVGKTSMEIGVRIISENLITKKNQHTNSCYITMVAVGKNMKPKEVPRLILETDIDKKRNKGAKKRKKFRKAFMK